ncbi:hypothetical protein B0J14DRAFT_564561 [Halenospora varia]|nr:hypothetical protein B0J14DRAFT_564561 [Halenospora varia]
MSRASIIQSQKEVDKQTFMDCDFTLQLRIVERAWASTKKLFELHASHDETDPGNLFTREKLQPYRIEFGRILTMGNLSVFQAATPIGREGDNLRWETYEEILEFERKFKDEVTLLVRRKLVEKQQPEEHSHHQDYNPQAGESFSMQSYPSSYGQVSTQGHPESFGQVGSNPHMQSGQASDLYSGQGFSMQGQPDSYGQFGASSSMQGEQDPNPYNYQGSSTQGAPSDSYDQMGRGSSTQEYQDPHGFGQGGQMSSTQGGQGYGH